MGHHRESSDPSRSVSTWIPAIVALGLLLALGAATASGGWAGHTPMLWFVLLTIVCVRQRQESWVVVLFLPALALFGLWFVQAAQSVTIPLGIGFLAAYLLDPIVDRLERRMNRSLAIGLLMVPLLLVIAALAVFLVPAVISEGAQLAGRIPELRAPLESLGAWVQLRAQGMGIELEWTSIADLLLPRLEAIGRNLVGAGAGVWRGVQGLIEFISFVVITPVVGFYLLRDIDRIRAGFLAQVPAGARDGVETFMGHVDHAVSGYLRGQLLVGLVVGALFALGLTILGMDYALLVGLSAVVLNLIPFVGSVLTAILAVSVALLSDPSWISVVKVGGLYAVVSGVDSVMSPRIMGDTLSLHPVVVMLAVLVAGQFLGLIGVLIAVPAAAVLKEALVVWAPQLLELLPIQRADAAGEAAE